VDRSSPPTIESKPNRSAFRKSQIEASTALDLLREAEEIFEKAEAQLDLDQVRSVIVELGPVAKSA